MRLEDIILAGRNSLEWSNSLYSLDDIDGHDVNDGTITSATALQKKLFSIQIQPFVFKLKTAELREAYTGFKK